MVPWSDAQTLPIPENTIKRSPHLGKTLVGGRTLTLADLEVNPREDWRYFRTSELIIERA